jgi:hypothetical protein
MHRLRIVTAASLLWIANACMPQHAQDVTDVARDLNVAARFGRMDVAAEHTTDEWRESFVQRRLHWGRDVRVVDTELTSLNMKDKSEAEVFVEVSWMRIDEGLLRGTRVKQMWRNPGGGWKLAEETRDSGDVGLFGERVVVLRPEPTPDARFPTKVIR